MVFDGRKKLGLRALNMEKMGLTVNNEKKVNMDNKDLKIQKINKNSDLSELKQEYLTDNDGIQNFSKNDQNMSGKVKNGNKVVMDLKGLKYSNFYKNFRDDLSNMGDTKYSKKNIFKK